jgi:hypothetical protein
MAQLLQTPVLVIPVRPSMRVRPVGPAAEQRVAQPWVVVPAQKPVVQAASEAAAQVEQVA